MPLPANWDWRTIINIETPSLHLKTAWKNGKKTTAASHIVLPGHGVVFTTFKSVCGDVA